MPFNLGFGEIFLILVLVLLLFGAKRIPEIAQSMGKGIREFKSSLSDVDQQVRGTPERDREIGRRADARAERAPSSLAAGDVEPQRDDDQERAPKRLLG